MAEKCPFCYRPLLTWKHDPILLPDGAPYDWISDTELVYEADKDNRWYKGIYQVREDEIIEIQEALETLETENDITPLTVFSPINVSGKFQFTGKHLKEMRDSIEGLLTAFGLTKTEYFNYDEDGNHIIHPNGDKTDWTDPITTATDLEKFQIKAIHIEDLRHFIQVLWRETWESCTTPTVNNILHIDNLPNSEIYYKDYRIYADLGLWMTSSTSSGSGHVIYPYYEHNIVKDYYGYLNTYTGYELLSESHGDLEIVTVDGHKQLLISASSIGHLVNISPTQTAHNFAARTAIFNAMTGGSPILKTGDKVGFDVVITSWSDCSRTILPIPADYGYSVLQINFINGVSSLNYAICTSSLPSNAFFYQQTAPWGYMISPVSGHYEFTIPPSWVGTSISSIKIQNYVGNGAGSGQNIGQVIINSSGIINATLKNIGIYPA
jgi:hypothetical protein